MARKIYGHIQNTKNNSPLIGARIRALDSDPGNDDLMGTAITDNNGDYKISYHGGHWDPAPHRITRWRPDIYITVSIKNNAGNWVKVKKSKVYNNHRLANDLRIDLDLNIYTTTVKKTSFSPKKHGYKFNNSFTIKPEVLGFNLGTWNMGLCGGMSAGALKIFHSNSIAPPNETTPAAGSDLYKELLARQIKSLKGIIDEIYDWQGAPDEGHWNRKHSVGYRTKKQWPLLKDELDKGNPTIIVLIRVEGYLSNISNNHQVLAIGYSYNGTTKDLIIYAYDPNKQNETTQLSMNLGLPNSKLNAEDSTGKRLRGFFVNPNTNFASQ